MVEKFREINNKISKEKGGLTLFAILKMDDLVDKWSIIISAPWINDQNHNEVFEYVRTLILEVFTPEERTNIARVGIFSKSDHIIDELLKYKKDTKIDDGVKINGNVVHEAYILESDQR